MRMTWICFFFNSNSHFLHTSEFSLCFLHTYFTGWQIASVKDGRSGCFQNKVILLEILLVRCPLWHPTLIHWHLSFNLLDLRGQATIKSRNAGEALLTRSATSVSLGYQAPPLGGLYSNGSGPLFGQKSARSLLRSDTFWGFTQERLQRHAEFSLVTARVPHLLGWGVRTKIQLIWKKTTKKRK